MRAFVITSAGSAEVQDVPEPDYANDEVLVAVESTGLCGTDVELFRGTMPYISDGLTNFPIRPGHEWAGRVIATGSSVRDIAVGQRVVGDTFIGCSQCSLCTAGKHHLCLDHVELGVRGDRHGSLAERLAVPAVALHVISDGLEPAIAALAEPGSCALRGVKQAVPGVGSLLVWGGGTLGLLGALFAVELGIDTTVVVRGSDRKDWVRALGLDCVLEDELGTRTFDGVLEATGASDVPNKALGRLVPGGRISLLGVPTAQSQLDSAYIVLNEITVLGILGGSSEIDHAIKLLDGRVNAGPLIAETIGLAGVAQALSRNARVAGKFAPKIQVDPRIQP